MGKLLSLLICFITGCATLSEDAKLVTKGSPTSKLLIYREHEVQASLISAYAGENGKYFSKLRVSEYDLLEINSGQHRLQIKTDAAVASVLDIDLLPNELTCIVLKPNTEALVPIYGLTVPGFLPAKTNCPSEEELKSMKSVKSPNNQLKPTANASAE